MGEALIINTEEQVKEEAKEEVKEEAKEEVVTAEYKLTSTDGSKNSPDLPIFTGTGDTVETGNSASIEKNDL